jgi:hypothetical protein
VVAETEASIWGSCASSRLAMVVLPAPEGDEENQHQATAMQRIGAAGGEVGRGLGQCAVGHGRRWTMAAPPVKRGRAAIAKIRGVRHHVT